MFLQPSSRAGFECVCRRLQTCWSQEEPEGWSLIREGIKVDDANVGSVRDPYSRFIFASGEPGAGKSEAVDYGAYEAARAGAHVFIGCPTGVLVSGYLDRLPVHSRITCETIHSGFSIGRKVDCDKHNPPSRLRRYELFFIDEVSSFILFLFRNRYI